MLAITALPLVVGVGHCDCPTRHRYPTRGYRWLDDRDVEDHVDALRTYFLEAILSRLPRHATSRVLPIRARTVLFQVRCGVFLLSCRLLYSERPACQRGVRFFKPRCCQLYHYLTSWQAGGESANGRRTIAFPLRSITCIDLLRTARRSGRAAQARPIGSTVRLAR